MSATRVKFRSIVLILMGLIAGLILSIGLDVSADKPSNGLPIDDLRKFASVFGTIKANYVDRVEDSDLIKLKDSASIVKYLKEQIFELPLLPLPIKNNKAISLNYLLR